MLKRFVKSGHRLQTKITALILCLSAVFSILLTGMQLTAYHYDKVEECIEDLTDLVNDTSLDIAYAVNQSDLYLQTRLLEGLKASPYVSYVSLEDQHGKQTWASQLLEVNNEDYIVRKTLAFENQSIGELQVYLNNAAIRSSSIKSALPSALIFLLETLLLSALILWLINESFTHRIADLLTSIDQINLGTTKKITLSDTLTQSGDEIGQISRSIQALNQRIRSEAVQKRLFARTLKQHQSILAEELTMQGNELLWQNRANTLLTELSLRLLKSNMTNANYEISVFFPEFAKLTGAEHVFWLTLEQEKVCYRLAYPKHTAKPLLDLSDMYLVKRWLMEAQDIAYVDVNTPNEQAIADPAFLRSLDLQSVAMFPLTDGRKSFGFLALTTSTKTLTWNPSKSLVLKQLSALLSSLMVKERDQLAMTELQEELIMANERLRLEAETDELTRLLNRRPFSRQFSNAIYDAVEAELPLAIMMIDIDHFKSYNDIYGHLRGDSTLKQVARAMNEVARQFDAPLARFGGEEFALLLPESDLHQAQKVSWQLCQAVRDLSIPHQGSVNSGILTISIGCVVSQPISSTQPNQLLELADQYLYRAKRAGRNRAALTVAESTLVTDPL